VAPRLPALDDFSYFEDAVRSVVRTPGIGPASNTLAVQPNPPPNEFEGFEAAVRGLPFAQQPVEQPSATLPEFAPFEQAAREGIQSLRRARLERGEQEAAAAYDSSRDIFAAGRPLLETPMRAWNALKGADLVGGYVRDMQDESVPLWARALQGTFGVPHGTAIKLATSGIGIRPTPHADELAERVARFGPAGEGGAVFGGVPGAFYDFLFALASDPLILASAPEKGVAKIGRQMAREGIETGGGTALAGVRPGIELRGYRKGPGVSIPDMMRGKFVPDEYVDRVLAPEMLRREIEKAAAQADPAVFEPKGLREALGLGTFDADRSVLAATGALPPPVAALRETLENVQGRGPAFPDYVRARDEFRKMPYESTEQLVPRSIRQSPLGQRLGFQQNILSDLEKGPTAANTKYRTLNPLWDPDVPLAERARLYAMEEAKIARGIKEGGPKLRFAGIKTPLTSPVPVAASLVGRAFGNWLDKGQELRVPLAERVVTPAGESGHAYVAGRQWTDPASGTTRDWSTAAPAPFAGGSALDVAKDVMPGLISDTTDLSNLEKAVRIYQTGAAALARGFERTYRSAASAIHRGGILTAASRAPGEASVSKPIFRDWLTRTLKSYSQAERGVKFDQWRSIYQLLHDVKAANPELKLSVELPDLKETLDEFDRLARDEKFWQPLVPDTVGPMPVRAFQQELWARVNTFQERMATLMDRPLDEMSIDASSPNVVGQLDRMTQNAAKFFDSPEGKDEIAGLFGALDEWLQAMVPADVAATNYNQVHQAVEVAGRRAAESARMQSVFESMLDASLRQPMSGLELTAKLLAGQRWNNPVRRALREMVKTQRKTVPELDLSAITPEEVAAQKDAMIEAIDKAQTAGRLTDPEVSNLVGFLDEVSANTAAWGGYMRLMKNVSDLTNYEMAVASVTKRVFEPLKRVYQRADNAARELSRKTMNDLVQQLSSEQVIYQPHGPGKWAWVKAALNRLDDTQAQIMRFAGVPEALARTVRENDDALLYADREAEGWVLRDFLRDEVEASIQEVKGLPREALISRRELTDLNEGYMKIAANEGADAFTHADPAVQTWVRQRGADRIAEGWRLLEAHFGDRAGAETWFRNMQARLNRVNEEMFNFEREMGMVDVRRKNYVPHLLSGSYADQDRFWRWMAGKEVDEWALGQRPLVSEKFAPGLTRDMKTMAELEYYLGVLKENLKGSQPLDLDTAYHLTAAMGHRRLLHNRAVGVRKFVTQLQSVMPGHLLPMGLARPDSKMAQAFAKAQFRNLGDLIPSLRDWWAHQDIYTFLESRVAKNATMLDFEGEVFGPWRFLRELQRSLKWLNTTFDIYHIKNIIALGLFSDTDLGRAVNIMSRAWKNRGTGLGAAHERRLAPIEAWVEGLEKDPMYQLGLKHGLTPFRGHEYQVPLVDRIMSEMRPIEGNRQAAAAIVRDYRLRGGPGSKVTFDIMDQAVKQAKFEEMLEQGIPAHHAADLANHYLIDYSLRWMNPNLRNTAYAIFPFFAWKIGNWAVHPTQFLERPGRYMVWNHLREAVTNFFTGDQSGEYYDALTEMAAGGMIIPLEDPVTGNQMVFDLALPSDSIFAPFRRMSQEHPFEWPVEFTRYFMGNIWDMPYRWLAQTDNQRRYEITQQIAQQGWQEWLKTGVFGTPEQEGWASSLTWGIQPWKDLGGLMIDPSKWQNWDFYIWKFTMENFGNTTQMVPSSITGKPRRAPLSP